MLLKQLINEAAAKDLADLAKKLDRWASKTQRDDEYFVVKQVEVVADKILFNVDDNLVGTDFYMTLKLHGDKVSVHIEQSNGNEDTISISPDVAGFEKLAGKIRQMADPHGDFY